MTRRSVRMRALGWAAPFCVLAGIVACGASDSSEPQGSSAPKAANGAACTTNAQCNSNVCTAGKCAGNGQLSPPGDACTSNGACASGQCSNGKCSVGTNLPNTFSCLLNGECLSGFCLNGACAAPNATGFGGSGQGGSNSGVTGTVSPPFQGLGNNWTPLATGCGPDTAKQCGGPCPASNSTTDKVIRPPATFCFGADSSKGVADPTPDTPAAMIEQVIETVNGVSYVHIRVTFDPAFADNTYGANASAGWYASANGKAGKGHTFYTDLTNSDHIELKLTDASGATTMELSEDYIHSLTDTGGPKPPPGKAGVGGATSTGSGGAAGVTSACGYANLGVLGGEGKMTTGSASDVLAAASSIDRNMNGCGYCKSSACTGAAGAAGAASTGAGDCTINSPLTDESYTPNPATPNWNYAIVYEVWVKLSAFNGGFGQAYITFVHASPSKIPGNNTLYVVPTNCPPTWLACPPGQTCPSTNNGAGGTGNTGSPGCPPNNQIYITLENTSICTPIPYAGWPNMAPCPENYTFTIDEQYGIEYCLPN